jgi:hypothetical protein
LTNIEKLIVDLIGGALGGNAADALLKKQNGKNYIAFM